MDAVGSGKESRFTGPAVAALEFFTRIPRPRDVSFHPQHARRSAGFAPLVGLLVGGIAALVFGLSAHVFPAPVCAVLALAAGVWVTGALHEDGFADVCDAFGAGVDRERTLEILKDPRCGAFALTAMVLLMLLKLTALAGTAAGAGVLGACAALVAAHGLSRLAMLTVMSRLPYARAGTTSGKSPDFATAPGRGGWILAIGAGCLAALPLPLAGLGAAVLSLIPLLLARAWLVHLFQRRIGGYTGDCLGTVQQVSEVIVLLGACAAATS
jgi:adenosylcobinamide-GDP ribazoletransferase